VLVLFDCDVGSAANWKSGTTESGVGMPASTARLFAPELLLDLLLALTLGRFVGLLLIAKLPLDLLLPSLIPLIRPSRQREVLGDVAFLLLGSLIELECRKQRLRNLAELLLLIGYPRPEGDVRKRHISSLR
jgi:hypothetical protein